MPNPTLTFEEFERRITEVETCLKDGFAPRGVTNPKGSALAEAARRLNLGRHAVNDALNSSYCPRQPDWSLYRPPAPEPEPTAPVQAAPAPPVDPNSELAKRNRELEGRLRETETHLRAALHRADTAENLREKVLRLDQKLPDEDPSWISYGTDTGSGETTVLTPLLFASDFQVGEVIDPDQLDGMNAYNADVFAERYQRLIDRSIDLSRHHVGPCDIPGIVYARGGDEISGRIHKELAETNDLQQIPALKALFLHERAGIRRLRDEFGNVHVISIPGNHDRTELKPQGKGYTLDSFATLLSWWLESSFDDDPRVTFQTPKSGDAFFDISGWKFLLSHGDRMGSRGGQGFVGPAATIARGHKKLYENWAMTGQRPDYILTGHLHTSLKLELGWANGSLAGYSEYARDLRCTPDAPKQWLLFINPKRGVSAQYEVLLGPRPRRGMGTHLGVAA